MVFKELADSIWSKNRTMKSSNSYPCIPRCPRLYQVNFWSAHRASNRAQSSEYAMLLDPKRIWALCSWEMDFSQVRAEWVSCSWTFSCLCPSPTSANVQALNPRMPMRNFLNIASKVNLSHTKILRNPSDDGKKSEPETRLTFDFESVRNYQEQFQDSEKAFRQLVLVMYEVSVHPHVIFRVMVAGVNSMVSPTPLAVTTTVSVPAVSGKILVLVM